jgi:hypothetical protein
MVDVFAAPPKTASGLYVPLSYIGAADGVAPLDSNALVPLANLPIAATSLLLAGAGAPSNSLGLNGDYYIDEATGNFYGPKAAGAWPAKFATLSYQPAATGLVAGTYYPNYALTLGTLQLVTGRLYAYGIIVPEQHTFVTIIAWCVTAGVASSLGFGIYADNGDTPVGGALVLDAGTVASNTSAATVGKAISEALPPGKYWLVEGVSAATTAPIMQADASTRLNPFFGQGVVAAGQSMASGFSSTGTAYAGAMPSTFPAGAPLASCPNLYLQA